jgi:peptidoglycan/LPS O-acetylase OafA/YrhL
MQRVKKIVPLALLAFVVYAIVKSPTQAADLVHTIWDIIVQGLTGIGGFFDAVLNKE